MDDKEFLKVYDMYSDAIFRHCFFRLRDRDEAKDLAQETFLRVWEYLSRGRRVENMKAFLYKVANNRIIDVLRKSGRVSSLDQLAEDGFDPKDEKPDNNLDKLDGAIALGKTAELPDIYKQVILLRFVSDLTIREIAEISGESQNVVSVRLHRGLRRLKKLCKLD